MRITRPQMFMEIAQVASKRATCMRLSVGAVIVRDRNIVALGYNGAPPGEPHCAGNLCPGRFKCEETVHAEMNALARIPQGVTDPMDLYVTDSPCSTCYQALEIYGRIQRVFFSTPYRITDHLERPSPISVYRVTASGYVMDWRTKILVEVHT